jgi:hypothetical protein
MPNKAVEATGYRRFTFDVVPRQNVTYEMKAREAAQIINGRLVEKPG